MAWLAEQAGQRAPVAGDATARLARAGAVLREVLDVVEERAAEGEEPSWSAARGWTGFLLGLSDDEVARSESGAFDVALQKAGTPASLAALGRAVAEQIALPRIEAPPRPLGASGARDVSSSKRAQIEALLGVLGPLARRASRIVDVGSGRGHLTRLASEAFDRGALGLERDAARVDAARELARAHPAASFSVFDACASPLALTRSDLALGLHACGELGDRLVTEVAASGASLGLVSCCFQKISGAARTPLAAAARGLTLGKGTLGLANLSAREAGVEAPVDVTMRAREARLALRCLLSQRGVTVSTPGEEMRGVNRRRARRGLPDLAAFALAARGLPPPTHAELEVASRAGKAGFTRARRFSIPRSLLARLVEVVLVLDRAARLEESGSAVRVGVLFDASVSPRNLVILSGGDEDLLPV